MMETTLAILLYLGAIFSHSTYHTTEIDIITQENEPHIQQVRQDDYQMMVVEQEFVPLVKTVVIMDYDED